MRTRAASGPASRPRWRRSERARALAARAEPRHARPAAAPAPRAPPGLARAGAGRRAAGAVGAVAADRPLDSPRRLRGVRARARGRPEERRPGDADARHDPPRLDARLPPVPPRAR